MVAKNTAANGSQRGIASRSLENASCRCKMEAEPNNVSVTPKKSVKRSEKSVNSDTCRICQVYFKLSVGNFGGKDKYISTENLFKIPQRAGVVSIPLADQLKAHLGVQVNPGDGKSSRVCAKCALKIRNASTLCEFIMTGLKCEAKADEENEEQQSFKRFNVVSSQRNVKKVARTVLHRLHSLKKLVLKKLALEKTKVRGR